MRRICFLWVLLASLSAASAFGGNALPGEQYRDLTYDGAWCWFADPRAVHYTGEDYDRTFAGWVNSQGDIMVGQYDHKTSKIRSHVVARRLERDDHAAPSLRILPDGRLMVFYSRHSDTVLRMRVSDRPGDIFSWSDEEQLALNDPDELMPGYPNNACYPNPISLSSSGDRLALLWRGTNWKPCISFSEDGGSTWSKGRVVFSEPGAGASNRPYLKATPARDMGDGKGPGIHLAFTTGHPRNEPTNSVYYARYQDGRFYRADGSVVGTLDDLPLAPSECDVVYDATETSVRAWIWDVAEDDLGKPVIAYTRLPAESRHVYHVTRRVGSAWQDDALIEGGAWFPHTPEGKMEPEPHYSGGIVLDHSDPKIAFLSRTVLGVFEIERWHRQDGLRGDATLSFDTRMKCIVGCMISTLAGQANGQACDWTPLSTGVRPAANACAVLENGDAVFGGVMNVAGPLVVGHIARWDGMQWNHLGTGVNDFV